MRNQLFVAYVADLKGNWESYRVFTAPINWRLESGDRIEANIVPTGENEPYDREISGGAIIPAGPYHLCAIDWKWNLPPRGKLMDRLAGGLGLFTAVLLIHMNSGLIGIHLRS